MESDAVSPLDGVVFSLSDSNVVCPLFMVVVPESLLDVPVSEELTLLLADADVAPRFDAVIPWLVVIPDVDLPCNDVVPWPFVGAEKPLDDDVCTLLVFADAEPLFGDTGSFTDDGDIVPLSDVVLPSCGVGSDAATLCDDVFISPFVDIDVLSLTDGTVPVFPDEFDVVAVSDRDVPELFVVSAVAPISDDVVSLPLIGADVPGVFCGPDVVDEVMMFVPALALFVFDADELSLVGFDQSVLCVGVLGTGVFDVFTLGPAVLFVFGLDPRVLCVAVFDTSVLIVFALVSFILCVVGPVACVFCVVGLGPDVLCFVVFGMKVLDVFALVP